MKEIKIFTNNKEETIALGRKIAFNFPNGITIALSGDLGAGKTTLVRGIAEGLHIKEIVQSPTFNIMKIYLKGDRPLIHIDAYRLADFDADIGLDEYIGYETGITVIEWPMYLKHLPSFLVEVEIYHVEDDKREFIFHFKDDSLGDLLN